MWSGRAAQLDVPEGAACAERDGGLGRSTYGELIAGGRRVHAPRTAEILAMVLGQVAERGQAAGIDRASLVPADLQYAQRDMLTDPTGVIRRLLGADQAAV